MKKILAAILFTIWTIQISAQTEFEAQIESFIEPILSQYKLIETLARINRYATSGANWSKRIDLKSKDLFLNKYERRDYQEYTFTFVYFDNKDSCHHARQEYLDHYSWKSGALTDSTIFTGRPPTFNLINENSIIIFEVSCEGYKMDETWSWTKIKEGLISAFGTDESEIIENGCGKPITWTNRKN